MISRRIWLVLSICVIAYALGLALDITPYLRGPDEWRWPRVSTTHWDQVWPVPIATAAIAGFVMVIGRRLERSPHPRRLIGVSLGLVILAAPVVQLLALRAEHSNPLDVLFDRSVDEGANGYFTVGYQITDVGDFLRSYPALMPTFPVHPQVHPPGIPLIYWLTRLALQRLPFIAQALSSLFRPLECNNLDLMLLSDEQMASALTGMLLPTLANMITIACIFRLAQMRFGLRAGLYAAALWTVVPSAVLFAGNWSQVYPLLACLAWLAVDAGLARRNIGLLFLAGLMTSLATFLELGTAALGLFLTLYILARYVIDRRNPLSDWRFLSAALIAALAGVSLVWLTYQIVYEVSLGQIIATMLPIHTGYEFDRLVWTLNHPYEFMVFLGLAIAGMFMVASVQTFKTLRTRLDRSSSVEALSVSFGIGLVILSLIDPARDETARTWMLLMPFSVVIASQLVADPAAQRTRFGLVWVLITLQLVSMIATLNVVKIGLQGTPPPSTVTAIPDNISNNQAEFGGMVRLIGHQLDRSQTDRWTLDLYWQAIAPVDHPYAVFNQVVNDQGQIVAQHDGSPQRGKVLMSCWQPGDLYLDRHVIKLTSNLPPGVYTLESGLYNGVTGARLPATGSNVGEIHQVILEQFEVAPASMSK